MTREGAVGRAKGTRPAIPDTITVTYLYPYMPTYILGQIPRNKPRSEGPRLLLEKKEKLDEDARCQHIVK